MIVGVPTETKTREYRVGMVPAGVAALTRRGHGESDYPATGYDIDTLVLWVRGQPTNSPATLYLALKDAGDLAGAQSAWEAAIALEPRHAQARVEALHADFETVDP